MKLCDFGLVHTKNTTAGTPAYMAPELLNDKPFSRKCDVYAFGVLLWEVRILSPPPLSSPLGLCLQLAASMLAFTLTRVLPALYLCPRCACPQMLNRHVPFHGWRIMDLKEEVTNGGRPKWPRGHGCPTELVAIVEQCWHANPERRPSFTTVEKQLKAWRPRVIASHNVSGGDSLDALLG